MSCTKNPKKFLWKKYFGPHDFRPLSITKFMWSSTKFIYTKKCINCGCEEIEHFATESELLEAGFRLNQIRSCHPDEYVLHDNFTPIPSAKV